MPQIRETQIPGGLRTLYRRRQYDSESTRRVESSVSFSGCRDSKLWCLYLHGDCLAFAPVDPLDFAGRILAEATAAGTHHHAVGLTTASTTAHPATSAPAPCRVPTANPSWPQRQTLTPCDCFLEAS